MPGSYPSNSVSWKRGPDLLRTAARLPCLLSRFGWLLACMAACAEAKESAACLSLRDRARDAAMQAKLDEATTRLREARVQCTAKSEYDLRRLEKLVSEKLDLQRQAQQRDNERQAQLEKAPAKSFVDWVTEKRDGVSNNVVDVRCAERGGRDFGFCEANHPTANAMTVRYWETQKGAFRYSFSTNAPLSCVDLGDHRRVRAWSRAQTSYDLCELTEHELRSLSALFVRSPGAASTLHVFSYAYVQRDKSFERLLQGKPEP